MFSSGGVQVLGRGLGLIGSTFGVVANVLIVVFFAVFMAAQPRMYVEGALHLVARKKRDRVREVLYEIGRVLRRWLVGQTVLAVCVAILTGAGLVLLGAPFPFALALLLIGVQLVESYVLAPLVQQRAVHLPPGAILFAQVLMGAIVGALGVAVATPLAAAIMVAVGMLYVEDALGDQNATPR